MRSVLVTIACTAAVLFPLAAFAGPPMTDSDGDGIPDAADNCLCVPNAPLPDGLDCDDDMDGIGNVCDGDINQSGAVNAGDISPFLTALAAAPGSPANVIADHNCSGVANAGDISAFLALLSAGGAPGPSGVNGDMPPCP